MELMGRFYQSSKPSAGLEPTALYKALPEDVARGQLLSSTRSEMYFCLELFHAHVKSVVRLMLSLIAAVTAILSLGLNGSIKTKTPLHLSLVTTGGGLVLCLMLPFGIISTVILSRYYRLYVSALVYSADLHQAEGIGDHQWFRDIQMYRLRFGGNDNSSLIRSRTHRWPHTWFLYSILILTISSVSFLFGIFVIVSSGRLE
jgi:hypothetical protein